MAPYPGLCRRVATGNNLCGCPGSGLVPESCFDGLQINYDQFFQTLEDTLAEVYWEEQWRRYVARLPMKRL